MADVWSDRRQALLLAADAVEQADAEAWAEAERRLFEARSLGAAVEAHPREGAADRLRALLTSAPEEAFPLPFHDLNECLRGGLRRGQSLVIPADPGQGKSQLLDQMLEGFARHGAKCHLYINEMTVAERDARWVQRRLGIAEERVLQSKLTAEEIERVAWEAEQHYPFDVTEIAGESFRDVAQRIMRDQPDVAAIDGLPRFEYRDERELRLGTGLLMSMALRANCALIVTHHLNEKRVGESGIRPRPTLTDIRDSGSIKNFADVVMFLHREQHAKEAARLLPEGHLWLAKVRGGKQGGVKVRFNERKLRFETPEMQEELDV